MYDGIDSCMPRKATLAAEPVSSKGINMTSTSGGRCGVDRVVYPDGDQQLSWLCDHPFTGLGKRQGGHTTRPQTL